MKLTDLQVQTFTEVLASDAPAPGGGSVAALSGALGTALTAMVCTLTRGRQKYAAHEAHAAAVQEQAEALRVRLLQSVDRDTEAFLAVSGAYAMPKATETEQKARSRAIQAGLALCTESPLEVMELTAEALKLVASLLEGFNVNSASDLGVAALSLSAALQGAWLNVRINAGSLKDRTQAEAYLRRGQGFLDSALPLADQVLREIQSLM